MLQSNILSIVKEAIGNEKNPGITIIIMIIIIVILVMYIINKNKDNR